MMVVVLDFFGVRAVAARTCAQAPKATEVTTSTPTIVQILRDVAMSPSPNLPGRPHGKTEKPSSSVDECDGPVD
jgi:hypothetical protein